MGKIIERIAQIISNNKLSVRAFEFKIGASNGMIGRAISKNTDISAEWLSKIIEVFPETNTHWLITGKGDMIKGDSVIFFPPKKTAPQTTPEPTIIYKSDPKDQEIIQLLRKQVAMSDKQIQMLEEKIKETDAHFQNARFGDPATVAEPPQPSKRAKSKS